MRTFLPPLGGKAALDLRGYNMKISEVKTSLSEIKVLSFRLKMALNVIDREEYIMLTNKLDSKIEKLIDSLKENED